MEHHVCGLFWFRKSMEPKDSLFLQESKKFPCGTASSLCFALYSPPPLHKRTASTTIPSALSIALINPCFPAAQAVSSLLKEHRVATQDEEILPKATSLCCGEVRPGMAKAAGRQSQLCFLCLQCRWFSMR